MKESAVPHAFNRTRARAAAGFTLIELMIVVAVIAILASVAYPSYLEYVKRTRRSEAKSVLLEAAQWAERYYTLNNAYTNIGTSLPTTLQRSPRSGTAYYTIAPSTAHVPTASTYVLEATPTGTMTGDKCGTFQIDETGLRSLSGNTAAQADCWDR